MSDPRKIKYVRAMANGQYQILFDNGYVYLHDPVTQATVNEGKKSSRDKLLTQMCMRFAEPVQLDDLREEIAIVEKRKAEIEEKVEDLAKVQGATNARINDLKNMLNKTLSVDQDNR